MSWVKPNLSQLKARLNNHWSFLNLLREPSILNNHSPMALKLLEELMHARLVLNILASLSSELLPRQRKKLKLKLLLSTFHLLSLQMPSSRLLSLRLIWSSALPKVSQLSTWLRLNRSCDPSKRLAWLDQTVQVLLNQENARSVSCQVIFTRKERLVSYPALELWHMKPLIRLLLRG